MIKQVRIEDIPNRRWGPSSASTADVKEFIKSGWPACKVDVDSSRNPRSVAACYSVAIKRLNAPCNVIQRKGEVFFVRNDK